MNDKSNTSRDPAEAIFDAAVQIAALERGAFLDRSCGADGVLRSRVEALLKAHEAAGTFLDEPVAPPMQKTVLTPAEERPGDKLGHYKILQKIGEGGCGIVYMAEQEEPVRRRVALKVIKLGMDTKQVIARFEAERQALAMMDHPNIARVLDAGATDNGRPYFVMELVRGIRITDYCDQNKLSMPDRLALFIQVCNAIQHAHQKGIIHRDIKPSNILVTMHDGVPVPKVIDFGIAKATQGRLTDQTLFTAFEQFIGTPAYMSPEQAEMSGLDVDTRSDIYALGVLLYELLTGKTPFDGKELLQAGLDELRRTIREKEPARPSTRLSTMLDADLTAVAQRRQSEAPKLIHTLSGDLDWIVMKALEKDRTRRYETANGFASDIQRHLTNETVLARPPTALYRFQKLVRRNKLAFAAGAAVLVALLLGLGLSTILFYKERKARQRAYAAEKVQKKLAEEAEARRVIEAQHARLGAQIGMAALFMTQGKVDEAENEIGPVPLAVLTNYVATAAIFNYAGQKHARHARWREAITNFSKVVAIVPSDFQGYHLLAPVLAVAGDAPLYRSHCEHILSAFGNTSDPLIASRIVEDALLMPAAGFAPQAVAGLSEKAVAAGTNQQHWAEVQISKALAEYRLGHYKEALTWARDARGNLDRYASAKRHLVLALARHQLDRAEDASSSLADALQTIKKLPKITDDGLGDQWNDWIIVDLLRREVETLIQSAK